MPDLLFDACFDILKTVPVLLFVYALVYVFEHKLRTTPALLSKTTQLGPVYGALAGIVPQCGFSAAASALYLNGYLNPATLIAVYLATSDEAIPVLLSGPNGLHNVILLLLCKIFIAIAGGYVMLYCVFQRKTHIVLPRKAKFEVCECVSGGLITSTLWRTAKTALFLLAVLFIVNSGIFLIGENRFSALLLGGTILQPMLCACIGLIPSCAISVLLSELYISGAIGFGSLVAGLSTGAGFGYVILFSDQTKRKETFSIATATWVLAAISGIVMQQFLG